MEKILGSDAFRRIIVSIPSNQIKIVMWDGTEDEESFIIRSLKRGTPYFIAYGVKYELTESEKNSLRLIREILGL